MSERWQMNRMGFVNFWLYDEEIFDFADGKLLLRGQNGSGKSITTQSFIPFILDGDRSPSRLDPFGSGDRRMEYYFLGEGEKEESTGYLFLEFKRNGVEQYRTIGIGQRAQKGKPMAFWGFMILDGRRVGHDLELYREVGTKKIPCTKQEMKQLLGDNNPYTEQQKEYMELVNRHLFGFSSLEQYGQFIRLLIKVRAPKLSKEFKPTKVYDILNDSLQTLSDEDLRAMVDAMEKMDEIQAHLEDLKAAFKDAQIIRNEYLRYNLYMLGKKAQAYVEGKKYADGISSKLEKKETEYAAKKQEIETRQNAVKDLVDEIRILETERNSFHVEDLEASVDKLQRMKKAYEEAKAEIHRLEDRIEKGMEEIRLLDGNLRTCQGDIEQQQKKLEKTMKALDAENETLQFALHREIKEWIYDSQTLDARKMLLQWNEGLKKLERNIRQGHDALQQLQEAQAQWDREEKKLQELLLEKSGVEQELDAASSQEAQCKDQTIEALYRTISDNTELRLSGEELAGLSDLIREYHGGETFSQILEQYHESWQKRNQQLEREQLIKESEKKSIRSLLIQQKAKLRELREMPDVSPIRKPSVEDARRILKEKNIPFAPFYEVIEFAEGMEQEEKNRVEGQLDAAGVLDALVVPHQDRATAMEALKELSDALILPKAPTGKRYPYLTVAAEGSQMKKAVEEILEGICTEKEKDADFVLASDGYFRHGMLEGYCASDQEAAYVGAIAREKAKERMLQEIQKGIDLEEENAAAIEEELSRIKERIAGLRQEYDRLPSCEDLNQALALTESCKERLQRAQERVDEQEAITLQQKKRQKEREQQVLHICRPLPYMRTKEVYEEAYSSAESYREGLTDLEHSMTDLAKATQASLHMEELRDKQEETIDTDHEYLRRTRRTFKEAEVEIAQIETYLNDPEIREITERLDQIKRKLQEKEASYHEHDKQLAVLQNNVLAMVEEIAALKEDAEVQAVREKKLEICFAEELELGLVMESAEASLYEMALKAQKQIREGDRSRTDTEVTTSLMKTFHAHLGTLSSYGIMMEDCFESDEWDHDTDRIMLRKRQRIAATWNGKKLYLEDFYTILRESIESTQLLIQKKDRELFEGILSDTLSQKLSSRIRTSRSWIKDMSSLMKNMDTSMGLTFSLEWRPKTAEGEGEMDVRELEQLLARDTDLIAPEDMDRVSAHFRMKIYMAKRSAEENGENVNYLDLVRDALDYRQWFEFHMNYYRDGDNRKELTNAAFNRFSGGEKAMAMYVPLFAAVNAQYKKAERADHPKMIALDEAFAGVDDRNISSMFALVKQMGFDYIMNSQVLWGCYETVENLKIAELLKPAGSQAVTVINYRWNGQERVLDEQ